MIGRLVALVTFVGLTVSSAAAWGTQPVLRQPNGDWTVDYAAAQCVAMMDYGTEVHPLTLALKPSPLGGVMRIVLLSDKSPSVEQVSATVAFDSDPPLKTNGLVYEDDKHHRGLLAIDVPMSQFRDSDDAGRITIDGGWSHNIFVVPQLPQVVAELDKCLTNLQAYWNFGEFGRRSVLTEAKPKGPLRELFNPSDYPWQALSHREGGSVRMVFLVDEEGKVDDCSVDYTSGISSLDMMSCYILATRARFLPARGPQGQPVRSAYCQIVVWKIADEGSVPMPPKDPRCESHPWEKDEPPLRKTRTG